MRRRYLLSMVLWPIADTPEMTEPKTCLRVVVRAGTVGRREVPGTSSCSTSTCAIIAAGEAVCPTPIETS